MAEKTTVRVPTVHLRGGSAIRRPLIVLAVCGVDVYPARDFLIPTAGVIVLALMLMPVVNTLERSHVPRALAAAAAVSLLALVLAGVLALAIPRSPAGSRMHRRSPTSWKKTLTGVRKSIATLQKVTKQVEQATTAAPAETPAASAPEKVVVQEGKSLLGQLASTTLYVILQLGCAAVMAFMLLVHRNDHRRQMLRVATTFATRVRLTRVMRDINERVATTSSYWPSSIHA